VERGPSRVEEDGASVYRAACQLGCEGIVSKRAAIEIEGVLAPAQARSRSWRSGLLPENYYAAPTDLSHGKTAGTLLMMPCRGARHGDRGNVRFRGKADIMQSSENVRF
jgi:hypothetical protein